MRRVILVILSVSLFPLFGQTSIELQQMPVDMPSGDTSIEGIDVVATESGSTLVTEMMIDGVRAFYMFVWTGDSLRAQAIGPRTIPARFDSPPTHQPDARSFFGVLARYWQVSGSEHQSVGHARHWVTAPSLPELTYAEVEEGEYPLTPSLESGLALEVVVENAGNPERACVLDGNILAVEDRFTSLGATWIRPRDERFLVVPVGTADESGIGRLALWLFDDTFRLHDVTPFDVLYDLNQIPEVIQVDLTGDGVEELVVVSTAPSAAKPVVVYTITSVPLQPRTLHFRRCGPRMQGDDVARLQRALVEAGYSVGAYGVDGWYGPDTRAAVIRYQRDRGVQPTGIFDMADPLP